MPMTGQPPPQPKSIVLVKTFVSDKLMRLIIQIHLRTRAPTSLSSASHAKKLVKYTSVCRLTQCQTIVTPLPTTLVRKREHQRTTTGTGPLSGIKMSTSGTIMDQEKSILKRRPITYCALTTWLKLTTLPPQLLSIRVLTLLEVSVLLKVTHWSSMLLLMTHWMTTTLIYWIQTHSSTILIIVSATSMTMLTYMLTDHWVSAWRPLLTVVHQDWTLWTTCSTWMIDSKIIGFKHPTTAMLSGLLRMVTLSLAPTTRMVNCGLATT